MARNKRISNPSILVNNNPIAIIPNSCTFTEGLGEQNVEPQSAGGNQSVTVYSENVESRLSTIKFEMANTDANIDLIRQWKANFNENVIVINGEAMSRTFTNAALTADYEVALGSDTNIELEWKSDPAV